MNWYLPFIREVHSLPGVSILRCLGYGMIGLGHRKRGGFLIQGTSLF